MCTCELQSVKESGQDVTTAAQALYQTTVCSPVGLLPSGLVAYVALSHVEHCAFERFIGVLLPLVFTLDIAHQGRIHTHSTPHTGHLH